MVDPSNPSGEPGIPDSLDPMDDPLLNAVERSIEDPSGLTEPLLRDGHPWMDDMARELDRVEASIENSPAGSPECLGVPHGTEGQADPDDFPGMVPLPQDELEERYVVQEGVPEVFGEGLVTPQDSALSSGPEVRDSRVCRVDPAVKLGSRPRGGPSRPGVRPRTRGFRPRGRTTASSGDRICSECHDVVTDEQCQACDKYRHWPEGADEEPRVCWHEWQAGSPHS